MPASTRCERQFNVSQFDQMQQETNSRFDQVTARIDHSAAGDQCPV